MKICVVGDIHFSEYSSILRTMSNKYSTRLENCLKSINWVESVSSNCDMVVYLGDFFDKSSLNANELTALSDISWNNIPHKFLVGNHEMGTHNLMTSSAHIFNSKFDYSVIDKPTNLCYNDIEICYLPYILEAERKDSIKDYFGCKDRTRIIFSHNDIAGIQMGKFISKIGFNIDDIDNNCDLFLNGHLHNEAKITNKIINVGNLTGQNFSEDGFLYKHKIIILDTDSLNMEVYDNPFAINFYKLTSLDNLQNVVNGAVSLTVSDDEAEEAMEKLIESKNVLVHRLFVEHKTDVEEHDISEFSVDYFTEFRDFVLQKIGTSDIILEELSVING